MPATARTIAYAHCKAIAHEWHDTEATEPSPHGQSIWQRCYQCGVIRMGDVDGHGDLIRPWSYYNYPQSWKDEPRLSKAEYRLELLFQQRQQVIHDRKGQRQLKVAE